jgi:hypothetical protein
MKLGSKISAVYWVGSHQKFSDLRKTEKRFPNLHLRFHRTGKPVDAAIVKEAISAYFFS